MDRTAVEQKVKEIVSNLTGLGDISPEMDIMEDLGLSSISLMELIDCLEQEFHISIKVTELKKIFTFGDLVDMTEKKVK